MRVAICVKAASQAVGREAAVFSVFPVGFYGISGSGKNARQESMVEVFFIIVIADGFSEKTVHFFGGSSTVFGPDGIK